MGQKWPMSREFETAAQDILQYNIISAKNVKGRAMVVAALNIYIYIIYSVIYYNIYLQNALRLPLVHRIGKKNKK